MADMSNDAKLVLNMSNGFFRDNLCTFESVNEYLDRMEKGGFDFDHAVLLQAITERHTVQVAGEHSVLEDSGDHEQWINMTTYDGLKREINWHYWKHYEDYLVQEKGFSAPVINELNESTATILSMLEDPLRSGAWDRRGLVMGSVQSGKTASYTGLITKAIDAGYKIVVVLTGVHNSLRSQTQLRLNDELLGYDSEKAMRMSDIAYRKIGVGKYPGHRKKNGSTCFIQSLTTSNENGDFKKTVAQAAGFTTQEPYVLVIKKHVSILKNLVEWLGLVAGEKDDAERIRVTDIPLLVVDDECDQASVNTKQVVRDPDTGVVDENCDPTKTNMRIRELLSLFDKSAYVGYSATPYANVFIHESTKHPKYGDDLFPRNFIVNLTQPANYVGPEKVFGIKDDDSEGNGVPLPLLSDPITDGDDFFPPGHKKELVVNGLPDSLVVAVKAFILASAARRERKTSNPHNTMLIHVTRFTMVQNRVKQLVSELVRDLRVRIIAPDDPLDDFRRIWESEFIPACEAMGLPRHEWSTIERNLVVMIRKIVVMTINGSSDDALLYKDAEDATARAEERGELPSWENRGAHIIAIGGNKLSRGLTLEGLTISYYLRPSTMYDTLMQMGRWFGYRPGYLDLCKIYTTSDIIICFQQIAKAEVNLRAQFDNMALKRMEPRDFGLCVLEDPGMLMITNAGKRRDTIVVDQNFSGKVSATVNFDPSKAEMNLLVLNDLVLSCNTYGVRESGDTKNHWKMVPRRFIIDFLSNYGGSSEATLVQPKVMADFINEQDDGDLQNWDVVLLSKESAAHSFEVAGKTIGCFKRVANTVTSKDIAIGTLLSPSHEWIDFTEPEQAKCFKAYQQSKKDDGLETSKFEKPPGPFIRSCRPRDRALLLIYSICSKDKDEDETDAKRTYGLTLGKEIYGFVASFPDHRFRTIRGRANSVWMSKYWDD
jgi:hypothetical protein